MNIIKVERCDLCVFRGVSRGLWVCGHPGGESVDTTVGYNCVTREWSKPPEDCPLRASAIIISLDGTKT